MTILEYASAGYDGRISECPPYNSSPAGMAFHVGTWCKAHGIPVQEIKASRGYTWIINRTLRVKFQFSSRFPDGHLITLA